MAAQHSLISVQEYLDRESASSDRHEFVAGSIYAMAGAGRNHALITRNLSGLLFRATEGGSCINLDHDVKVFVESVSAYFYPDASVSCPPSFIDERSGVISNPTVLFEVISPKTEKLDRGLKFAAYRTLESLRDYVLVESESMSLEVHSLQEGEWIQRIYSGVGAIADLPSVGIRLALDDLYRHVSFAGE